MLERAAECFGRGDNRRLKEIASAQAKFIHWRIRLNESALANASPSQSQSPLSSSEGKGKRKGNARDGGGGGGGEGERSAPKAALPIKEELEAIGFVKRCLRLALPHEARETALALSALSEDGLFIDREVLRKI